jgi:MOSC domain-containing protein YiiM
VHHATREELQAGLEEIRRSPADQGSLRLIVRRPAVDAREVLETGRLDPAHGLVGDSWLTRDRHPDPDTQLNIMNARVIALIAGDQARWALAGDQLYVDLDLSEHNLPAGTRLRIGGAVIEVTPEPHTGCAKFVRRFGLDAMKVVNSPIGRQLRLRGLNARVVHAGDITVGDAVRKAPVAAESEVGSR